MNHISIHVLELIHQLVSSTCQSSFGAGRQIDLLVTSAMVQTTSAVSFALMALKSMSIMVFPMKNMQDVQRAGRVQLMNSTLPQSASVRAPNILSSTTFTTLPIAPQYKVGQQASLEAIFSNLSVLSATSSRSATMTAARDGNSDLTRSEQLQLHVITSSTSTSSLSHSTAASSPYHSPSTRFLIPGDTITDTPGLPVTVPAATTITSTSTSAELPQVGLVFPQLLAALTPATSTIPLLVRPSQRTTTVATSTYNAAAPQSSAMQSTVPGAAAVTVTPFSSTIERNGADTMSIVTAHIPSANGYMFPDPPQVVLWNLHGQNVLAINSATLLPPQTHGDLPWAMTLPRTTSGPPISKW
ncbi:hypothetical protein L208DRAFT_719042 [Tricholoma matsutake]|nr:hypothetical protein L208DRAFT_719042 [Tricholoma matsutake 945]